MEVVELRGSARERGRQLGEATRHLVARSRGTWAAPAALVATRRPTRRQLPVQAQRVRGLAEVLGVPAAWGAQLLDVANPVPRALFVAAEEATASRGPLLGTADVPHIVARRDEPLEAGRLATATVAPGGLAGTSAGVNERGLACSAHGVGLPLGAHRRLKGVPLTLLAHEILETCPTAEAAIRRIQSAWERADAGVIGLCDATGAAFVVEITVAATGIRAVRGAVLQRDLAELAWCGARPRGENAWVEVGLTAARIASVLREAAPPDAWTAVVDPRAGAVWITAADVSAGTAATVRPPGVPDPPVARIHGQR